jgi:hypothetical protein
VIVRRRQSPPRQMDLSSLSHQALFAAVRSIDAAAVRALLADTEASGTTTVESPRRRTHGRRHCTSRRRPGPRTSCACSSPLYDFEGALPTRPPCLPRRSQARTVGGEAREEERVSGREPIPLPYGPLPLGRCYAGPRAHAVHSSVPAPRAAAAVVGR